jgi:hypothetical protein
MSEESTKLKPEIASTGASGWEVKVVAGVTEERVGSAL